MIACRCITRVGGVVATGALLVRGGSVRHPREIFRQRILGRHLRLGLHAVPIYRRALPLPRQCAPNHPREREHRLRLACGNGLRADIWENFKARFAIPRILEFYAATEGNVSLYNVEGKLGAIGRVPPFLAHRFPLALVKFDAVTGAPMRDAQGRCHPLRDQRNRRSDRPDRPRHCGRRRRIRRLYRAPRTPSGKFCATCSSRATPGFAPAT